jgi:hypothetical protein
MKKQDDWLEGPRGSLIYPPTENLGRWMNRNFPNFAKRIS